MNINNQIRIVYTPKKGLYPEFGKRFFVSGNRLKLYIGVSNADKAIYKGLTTLQDKLTLKFRKFGKIEIYQK